MEPMTEILRRGDADALPVSELNCVARGLDERDAVSRLVALTVELTDSARLPRGLALIDPDGDGSSEGTLELDMRDDTLGEPEARGDRERERVPESVPVMDGDTVCRSTVADPGDDLDALAAGDGEAVFEGPVFEGVAMDDTDADVDADTEELGLFDT